VAAVRVGSHIIGCGLLTDFGFKAGTAKATADAVTGASGFGMSDGAVFDTGGVLGADFSSLLILFVFSDMTIAAATGAAADSVTGALVRFEKSDGAIPYAGGVVGVATSFDLFEVFRGVLKF
jgi:hypothetical protein